MDDTDTAAASTAEDDAAWSACLALWLDHIERRCGSTRSRAEYERIVEQFAGWRADRGALWRDITPTLAQQWASDLSRRLAPASVNKSLAIMSSFYDSARRHYFSGAPLWTDNNPFGDDRLRTRVQRYARARYPSTEQVRAIFEVIDTSSPRGLRDMALFGGLFATTRRINEWLPLRWSDIHGNTFTVRLKGGRILNQVAPDGLLAQVVAWLNAAGRYPPEPGDYVFTAIDRRDRPLNAGHVNNLLRRYGALAGVPGRLCHAHGLRHAGARWRYQQGATAHQLQQVLGHQNMATTEIYIRGVLAEPDDALAGAVDDFFASLTPAQIRCSRVLADSSPH